MLGLKLLNYSFQSRALSFRRGHENADQVEKIPTSAALLKIPATGENLLQENADRLPS
jgi:hypothetical protein